MQNGVDGIVRHECRFLRSDGGVVWVMVSTSRVPATVDAVRRTSSCTSRT